jgi:hypothetical protein
VTAVAGTKLAAVEIVLCEAAEGSLVEVSGWVLAPGSTAVNAKPAVVGNVSYEVAEGALMEGTDVCGDLLIPGSAVIEDVMSYEAAEVS